MTVEEIQAVPAVKGGRCFNGAHRDRGQIVHLVEPLPPNCNGDWFKKALCGAETGRRSYGWTTSIGPANCPKCLKKSTLLNQSKEKTI